jgi:hypothetical protein
MSEETHSVLPESALSEGEFLEHQAQQAQAAIARALANAKAALAEGVDPREWTRRFPIIAIGSAAAAGFTAALLAVPSKEQQELRRLEKIQQALHPESPKTDANGKPKEQRAIWMTLLLEAAHLIRPVLTSLLFSGLKNASPKSDYQTRSDSAEVHDNPPPP